MVRCVASVQGGAASEGGTFIEREGGIAAFCKRGHEHKLEAVDEYEEQDEAIPRGVLVNKQSQSPDRVGEV